MYTRGSCIFLDYYLIITELYMCPLSLEHLLLSVSIREDSESDKTSDVEFPSSRCDPVNHVNGEFSHSGGRG